MLGNIFYGLSLIAGGFFLLKYRKQVHEWTGGWGWAEHYLGRGSTYGVICLIACFMVIIGIAKFFGLVEFKGTAVPKSFQIQTP